MPTFKVRTTVSFGTLERRLDESPTEPLPEVYERTIAWMYGFFTRQKPKPPEWTDCGAHDGVDPKLGEPLNTFWVETEIEASDEDEACDWAVDDMRIKLGELQVPVQPESVFAVIKDEDDAT